MSRRMLDHSNDFAGWWAGLGRLPTRRSDGETEDMPGWHRVLWGDESVKRYHGAFQFTLPTWHRAPKSPGGDPIDYTWRTQAVVAVLLKHHVGTTPWPKCG